MSALKERKPEKYVGHFLAELVAGLRASGQSTRATDLERCFRYGETTISPRAALAAVELLTEARS